MIKSCIKLLGLALIFGALPISSGLASVSRETLLQHPANSRLARIISANNLTNKAAPKSIPFQKNKCVRVIDRMAPVAIADLPEAPEVKVGRPDIYRQVVIEARRAGISPVVMYAIMHHETGGFTSAMWRESNNPGGIRGKKRGIGVRRSGYTIFASQAAGIRAEGDVLAHPRYDSARQTSNLFAQVDAISAGRYANYSKTWPGKVKAYIRRMIGGVGDLAHSIKPKRRKRAAMVVD